MTTNNDLTNSLDIGQRVTGTYYGVPFAGTVGNATRWHTLRPSLEVSVLLDGPWVSPFGDQRERIICSVHPDGSEWIENGESVGTSVRPADVKVAR
jgi:hypothetical protein